MNDTGFPRSWESWEKLGESGGAIPNCEKLGKLRFGENSWEKLGKLARAVQNIIEPEVFYSYCIFAVGYDLR